MRIDEIERQMVEQHSAMRAFPSQAPSLEQIFSGQNQRASTELQITSAKLLVGQDEKLEKINEVLKSLSQQAERHQISVQKREKIEDLRHKENTRFIRIAAWSESVNFFV